MQRYREGIRKKLTKVTCKTDIDQVLLERDDLHLKDAKNSKTLYV
jgi:hypothetical protein